MKQTAATAAASDRRCRWLWHWGPVVACMALIFTVSAMSRPPAPPRVGDKTLHFLAYGTLGGLALRATSGAAMAGVSASSALTAWAIASAYGVTDEFHQRYVPGRTPDVGDLVADALGAMAAVVPVWAFGILARWRQSTGAFQGRR